MFVCGELSFMLLDTYYGSQTSLGHVCSRQDGTPFSELLPVMLDHLCYDERVTLAEKEGSSATMLRSLQLTDGDAPGVNSCVA